MIRPFWTIFYFMHGPNIRWAFHRTIGPLVRSVYYDVIYQFLRVKDASVIGKVRFRRATPSCNSWFLKLQRRKGSYNSILWKYSNFGYIGSLIARLHALVHFEVPLKTYIWVNCVSNVSSLYPYWDLVKIFWRGRGGSSGRSFDSGARSPGFNYHECLVVPFSKTL